MKKPTRMLTAGEYLDRFTILIRKAHFDPDSYLDQLNEYIEGLGEEAPLLLNLCRLMMANTDVWHLESDIRKGREDELGLAEVGKRSIKIREHNKDRITAINALNQLFGEKFCQEKKFDHGSED